MSNPLPPWPDRTDRAGVRAWLIEGGDVDAAVEGVPVWALAMVQDSSAAFELLDAGTDPNRRSPDGKGWLHWGIETQQPEWLILAGLRRLGNTWWHPDVSGRTPFHLPLLTPGTAQALGRRWWADGRPWRLLGEAGHSPEAAADARGDRAIARVWRGWERVCSRSAANG